jgi:hypothetical protein
MSTAIGCSQTSPCLANPHGSFCSICGKDFDEASALQKASLKAAHREWRIKQGFDSAGPSADDWVEVLRAMQK